MLEATIAVLCTEVINRTVTWSGHYALRVFERAVPEREEIRYLLCDDEPQIIELEKFAGEGERGRECLIWGIMDTGRIAHVFCTFPPNPVIITAYWPAETESDKWEENFMRRVRR